LNPGVGSRFRDAGKMKKRLFMHEILTGKPIVRFANDGKNICAVPLMTSGVEQ
jgi:hypothetical protein